MFIWATYLSYNSLKLSDFRTEAILTKFGGFCKALRVGHVRFINTRDDLYCVVNVRRSVIPIKENRDSQWLLCHGHVVPSRAYAGSEHQNLSLLKISKSAIKSGSIRWPLKPRNDRIVCVPHFRKRTHQLRSFISSPARVESSTRSILKVFSWIST